MTSWGLTFSVASVAIALAAVAGQLRRRRVAAARFLFLYLLVAVATRPPVWLWPDRFYTWGYWLATDLLQTGLAMAAAVETNWLAFGHLPSGRRRAAFLLALVAAAAFALVLAAPGPAGSSAPAVYYAGTALVARATLAAGALFAVFLGLSYWHLLPSDPFHLDVAGGFILWAILMAWGQQLVVLDPLLGLGRHALERLIHLGVLSAWAAAAWRRDDGSDLSPAALVLLQPWRRPA